MDAAVEAGKKPANTNTAARQTPGMASPIPPASEHKSHQKASSGGANGKSRAYQSSTKSSAARKHERGLSDVGPNGNGEGKKYGSKTSTGGKGDGVPKAG